MLFRSGSVGLYQVNAVVPTGVLTGRAVPVVVTVGMQASQDGVTIAVLCSPSNLPWTVNLTSPAQGGTIIAYQAADLEAKVVDGCNTPVDGANVSVTFSNGDQYQKLTSIGGGVYRGSWTPTNVPGNVAQTSVLLQVVASPQIGQKYKQGGQSPIIAVTVVQQVKSPALISQIVNSPILVFAK